MTITYLKSFIGVLHKAEEPDLSQSYIVILNIDVLESVGVTSLFFDWLAHGVDKKENGHLYCNNGGEAVDDFYQFHKDVTLLAFATNSVYVLVFLSQIQFLFQIKLINSFVNPVYTSIFHLYCY